MKKIWNICRWEIQLLFSNRSNYLMLFAMPLLFTFIFGGIFTSSDNEVEILYVDQDKTNLSEQLFEQLQDNNKLFTVERSTEKNSLKLLEDKKAVAVITIAKGFKKGVSNGGIPAITFQHIPEFTSSQMVTNILASKLAKISTEVTASEVWSQYSGSDWQEMYDKLQGDLQANPSVKMVELESEKAGSEQNGLSRSASGFSIMFLMLSMMSVTGAILEAKTNKVWYRLMSTPATRFEIAFGYLLSFFLIGWLQFGILMFATNFIFGVNWGNPFALVILVSAIIFAVVGLALVIASISKTTDQLSSYGNLIVISTCMLAGIYWPLEVEPLFMRKIAEFLPQTWAMRGFQDITTYGSIFSSLDNIAGLLLFATVFLLIGIRNIRFN